MNKFKRVLFGFVGLCLLAALPLAQAQNSGPEGQQAPAYNNGPWSPSPSGQGLYSMLNLTDEQKRQLQANKEQHRAIMGNLHMTLKRVRQTFQQELMDPQVDMSTLNATHNRIKNLMNQMEDDKFSSILAVRAILTPQQFAIFVQLTSRPKQQPTAMRQ